MGLFFPNLHANQGTVSLVLHSFALTSDLSYKLARKQVQKHVPIRVLVVDVESLGGAQ